MGCGLFGRGHGPGPLCGRRWAPEGVVREPATALRAAPPGTVLRGGGPGRAPPFRIGGGRAPSTLHRPRTTECEAGEWTP